jgi:hypothetical protein
MTALRATFTATRILLGLILALGLGLRLAIAWTDTSTLVVKTLPDDAFYYFAIVENALAGRGVTFDGLAPTNGFHPLWALLLLPIFKLSSSRDTAIHVALTAAALFDAGTIYLAYRAGRRLLANERAGLLAAGLYGLNPRLAMESVNGLETAVSTLTFALLAYFYLRMSGRRLSEYAALGMLAGLAVWGRTDAIFLAAAVALHLLWRRRGAAIVPLLVAGAAGAAMLAPWVLWNLVTFGSPLQTSGMAVPYVVRTYLFELSGVAGALRVLGPPLYLASVMLRALLDYAWLPLAALAAYALMRLLRRGQPGPIGLWSRWAAPLIGAGLLLAFHTFGRYFVRGWYVVPAAFVLAVAGGAALAHVQTQLLPLLRVRWAYDAGCSVIILTALIAGGASLWRAGFYPWQTTMLEAAQWAARETAPTTVIGAFNAGIMGWYAGRPVINLDGVVSEPAFAAVRQRRLLAFLHQHHVGMVIDWRSSVEQTYQPFFEAGYRADLEVQREWTAPAGASGAWDVLAAYRVR